MTDKFLTLPPEKQERILNASIKEFALKGFRNASTNEIVKEAGISKGLLFHYFNNKKDLFIFLYVHFSEILIKEFFEKLDPEETDIFNKLKQISILKIQLMEQYPEIFDFFMKATVEEDLDIKQDLDDRNNEITENSFARLFANVDISKFREDVEIDKAINIILWTFEGIKNRNLDKLKLLPARINNYQEMFDEIAVYVEILKKSLYR
ncbi:TetR/AcrR family transcriptional regulator [Alkaliphilus hydrothermalis]|uniref:AcrR family transcriptional regulator n=1 Tax=Alkaliphilus hydrothermalis TaxID=1482730 RepID=A0ABS2NLN6_9FIRM|nr:TetR/AcrR family transcriptional regulator [Alkaliphilus hydrothermalis]MBM7613826.1 AcrR family transcriptional regulator [Alkaliphilus hydrothermalis]